MASLTDLTGQKFGRLLVVEQNRDKRYVRWKCLCDCGGVTITTTSKLKSGHTKSCGCLQRERSSKASRKDLTGEKFGRLEVLYRAGEIGKRTKYVCKCECGNSIIVYGCNLVTGATASCGCARKESAAKLRFSHGKWGSRLYRCWRNMIDRCNNPKNKEYRNYGGRGICVCQEWESSFETFYLWAMSNGYRDDLTIERIDVDSGYSPKNCTFADYHVQSRNRTNNRKITFRGETMVITDWAKEVGISEATIRKRLNHGWSVEKTMTMPTKNPDGKARKR